MQASIQKAIQSAFENEPLPQAYGMQLTGISDGHARVEMILRPQQMNNLFGRAHGGAIYALMDEAFEIACQTDGSVTVALNVNVSYVASPSTQAHLIAQATRVSQSRKTAAYTIEVTEKDGPLIAICQAMAYRTHRPLPFLQAGQPTG